MRDLTTEDFSDLFSLWCERQDAEQNTTTVAYSTFDHGTQEREQASICAGIHTIAPAPRVERR
eukprot:1867397-Amphidinium_carterae.2